MGFLRFSASREIVYIIFGTLLSTSAVLTVIGILGASSKENLLQIASWSTVTVDSPELTHLFIGLQGVVSRSSLETEYVSLDSSTSCPGGNYCGDCKDAGAGALPLVVLTFLCLPPAAFVSQKRSRVFLDSAWLKLGSMALSLPAAIFPLIALTSFASGCHKSLPDTYSYLQFEYTTSRSFGPAMDELVTARQQLELLSAPPVIKEGELTPVYIETKIPPVKGGGVVEELAVQGVQAEPADDPASPDAQQSLLPS
ncbi:hypothetical protein CYMTET_20190 [Cymbomonas tetramitiformis]|uniref:Transmembrane protein n=1 Tax=Cymbomonas tetramitiformis TaxID=36881 RepID=A0AAE0L4G4_9CHLO|nr:hypothetical protein CYMTET_20190 [Cymbomonas tetramitiformis]